MRGAGTSSFSKSAGARTTSQPSQWYGKSTGSASQNPDFADLNTTMDTVTGSLARLRSEIKQKTACFQSEIGNIETQIKSAQTAATRSLADQKAKEEAEIEALKQVQEAEVESLQNELTKALKSRSRASARRNETVRLQKEAELAQLRHDVELRKIQREADEFAAAQQSRQSEVGIKERQAELNVQIELLDAEINDVTASTAEDRAQSRSKLDAAVASFESRNREGREKVQRYRNEIAKRKQIYGQEMRALEGQAEMKKAQLDNALEAANQRLASLKELISQCQTKGAQEVQQVMQEIEELKAAIAQAKEREEKQLDEAKEQIVRLRGAQRDAVAIEQEVAGIKDEVAQMKKENQELRRECNRVDALQYQTRIAKCRALLH
jgi:DNA repair exonuclease SbcCD ATPase subunit